jgi:heme O synthase-like polyprenyltransferase
MNKTQIKCLIVFSIFAIIGFGPISPGCLIGMTVVAFRPRWFWQVAVNLYADTAIAAIPDISESQSKLVRKKCFLSILALFIVDIAPVPVTPVVAFFIIFLRPLWFYRLVAAIYQNPNQVGQVSDSVT